MISPVGLGQEEGDIDDEFAFLEAELEDDEVKSASKRAQSIYWSPSAITVITRQEIRESGAVMLAELLRRVAGIDIVDLKYGFPVVGARALTDESNNLMLVLIDGREALLEFAGVTMWTGLAPDIEEIERIEVIRGPGSTLYGANAFAGVVNIVTVVEKSVSRGEVNFHLGNLGFIRMNGILREYWMVGEGELSVQFSVGQQAKRSSTDHGMRYWLPHRAHAVVRYRLGKTLDLSLHGGHVLGNGLWHTHVGDLTFKDSNANWVMLKGGFSIGEIAQLRAQLYYSDYRGKFSSRTNLWAFGVWLADFPTFIAAFPVADGQLQLDIQLGDDLLLMTGANLRYVPIECQQFTNPTFDELRAAGFLQAQWTIANQVQLTGGLRLDYSDKFDLAVSPRFVAVYRPLDNQSFRAGYGLAFRKPSLYESHAHFTVEDYNDATPEIVEKLRTSLGNEDLTNEKVHSFEIGYRAGFFEDRLRVTLDGFFNIYQDTIYFHSEMRQSMGMPNIRDSIIKYENDERDKYALGGELELVYRGREIWQVWGNLGLRRVTWADTGEKVPSEPTLRANLGGRYFVTLGTFFDLVLHYVSTYSYQLADPLALLDEREYRELGNRLMLVGRLGYRIPLDHKRQLEAGLTIRAPLGEYFREYPGRFMPTRAMQDSQADWGGEVLMRWVSFYLRGIF